MSNWTQEELQTVDDRDEVTLATTRKDGTLRRPVIVWIVRHNNDLYVRSVRGRTSDWFRGVQSRWIGRLKGGRLDKSVKFVEEHSPEINAALDQAYARKYRHYAASIIDSINGRAARTATLRLEPV